MRLFGWHWKLLGVLFAVSLFGESECSAKQGKDGWTHEIDLTEKAGVNIQWRNTKDLDGGVDGSRWIEMKVSGKTQGYVGLGFSPTGGMNGADIVIGWVDSEGSGHLRDFHGVSNGQPIEDPSHDYVLLNATQVGEWTTLVLKRKWETCDEEHDLPILNDTMKVIWALGEEDPVLEKNGSWRMKWHGPEDRGVQNTFMLDHGITLPFPDEVPEAYPGVKTWDMVMEKNEIKGEVTTYFCRILKFPDLERKHHMIGLKPVLTPETEKHVHHIVFYQCYVPPHEGGTESIFEKHLSHPGGRCYTPAMPPEWAQRCDTFLFVWARGSEGEMLPLHVGSALGEEHGGATYFMFEVHYDNPGLETFVDSSGVRIFYTDQLRPNEGSIFTVGLRVTPFHLLPPKQQSFKSYAVCSEECTETAIPSSGIHVINTMLHAHVFAKKLKLRHIRNGTELPVISQESNYEFNYQQSRILNKEVNILPGDQMIMECEYGTVRNNRIVLGGLATSQEMCLAFLYYYPKIDLQQCQSQPEAEGFFEALGINEVEGSILEKVKIPFDPKKLTGRDVEYDLPDFAVELQEIGEGDAFKSFFDYVTIKNPQSLKGKTVGTVLKEISWEKKDVSHNVEQSWKLGNHYTFCTGHGRKRLNLTNYTIPYPKITFPLIQNESGSSCDKQ